VVAALEAQCARAQSGDEIVLFGSFYCVAEALDWLARQANGELQDGFAG
jgi:dihydrofolate synthase / folylpolyglutamate synthase